MLHQYYKNLSSIEEKSKFIETVKARCLVKESTVRSWVANPEAVAFRNPKSVYQKILSRITKIKESELFNN